MNCTICSKPASRVGIFQPDNSQDFDAPNGKSRSFRYLLCEHCAADPGVFVRIEKIIEHALTEG
jgi:hypothetical protein